MHERKGKDKKTLNELEQDKEGRKVDFKAGKALVISGHEVLEFRPILVDEHEEADGTCDTQATGEEGMIQCTQTK